MLISRRYYVRHTLTGSDAAAIFRLKQEIARRFRVYGALLSCPHVTLRYHFETSAEDELKRRLAELADESAPFVVPVAGFGSFEQGVWFIDTVQTSELRALKSRVVEAVQEATGVGETSEWDEDPHFHITLAFRDVTPDSHRLIGEFLRDRQPPIAEFKVDSLTLCRKDLLGLTSAPFDFPFGQA